MSRRYVLTFQSRFAPLVASGAKKQTIRPVRKDGRSPAPGDLLSLRAWSGLPYRSKQAVLRPECPCVASQPVFMNELSVWVGVIAPTNWLNLAQRHELAKADGFADYEEMLAWFCETHDLPFKGVIIQW